MHCLPAASAEVKPSSALSCHKGVVTTVDLSANCNGHFFVASGGSDYSLVVYRVSGNALKVHWRQEHAHASVVTRVLFGVGMASGVVYSGAKDRVIHLWSLKNGECVGSLDYHQEKVVDLCQTPDGRFFVSASADRTILVYDVSAEFRVVMRVECGEEPACVAVVNNTICCGFCSGALRFWSLPSLGILCDCRVCGKQRKRQIRRRSRASAPHSHSQTSRQQSSSFPPHRVACSETRCDSATSASLRTPSRRHMPWQSWSVRSGPLPSP